MAIQDSIVDYNTYEKVYNQYISDLEKASQSNDWRKCQQVFESCRKHLQEIPPAITAAALSPEQVNKAVLTLKEELNSKTAALAWEIIKSKLNIFAAKVYQDFSQALRREILKAYVYSDFGSTAMMNRLPELLAIYDLDEQSRFEIAKVAFTQQRNLINLDSNWLKIWQITNQEMLYDLAKIHVKTDPLELAIRFRDYGILDPDRRFEIAKLAAAEAKTMRPDLFINFDLKNPKQIAEVLEIWAPGNLDIHLEYLKHDSNIRDAVIQIAAARPDWGKVVQAVQKLQTVFYVLQSGIDDDKKIALIYCWLTIRSCKAETSEDFTLIVQLAGGLAFPFTREWLKDQPLLKKLPLQYMKWFAELCFIRLTGDVKKELETAIVKLRQLAAPLQLMIDPIISCIQERRSLQQQKKDLAWLGAVMIACAESESPLSDKKGVSLMRTIWKATDPALRTGATLALTSVYKNPEKVKVLYALLNEKKDYLNVVVLCCVQAGINPRAMLQQLDTRYYRETRIMNSIFEMVQALSAETVLSSEKKESLLNLVFNAPVKGDRESRPKFNERIADYRIVQADAIAAIHTLLFFGKGALLLKNLSDVQALLTLWKNFMAEAFHIQTSALSNFIATFCKSKRYSNGLVTYASRLQTLPADQKTLIMPLLGKFAGAVLDGTYPQIRYDFSGNRHLETVFSNNGELLKKWQTALSIKINKTKPVVVESPEEQIRRSAHRALSDRHLGEDQETFYPGLAALLAGKTAPSPPPDAGPLEQQVVRKCATLLDPKSDLTELKAALDELLKLLPEDVEFRNDVKSMLERLSPQASEETWVIEDSDAWEDMELMGTEVDGSCQRIDGDPFYNKCLLSYIFDGKNRIMIARDSSGRIVARAVLRILWDETQKKPVLFVERLYIRGGSYERKENDILEGCRQKAEYLNIPLVASARDYILPETKRYPGLLKALGGPAPFEYVDALGGIQRGGIYTISESLLLWSPSTGK